MHPPYWTQLLYGIDYAYCGQGVTSGTAVTVITTAKDY